MTQIGILIGPTSNLGGSGVSFTIAVPWPRGETTYDLVDVTLEGSATLHVQDGLTVTTNIDGTQIIVTPAEGFMPSGGTVVFEVEEAAAAVDLSAPTIAAVNAASMLGDEITVTTNADVQATDVEYRINGGTAVAFANPAGGAVTGLVPTVQVTVECRQKAGAGAWSPWSAPVAVEPGSAAWSPTIFGNGPSGIATRADHYWLADQLTASTMGMLALRFRDRSALGVTRGLIAGNGSSLWLHVREPAAVLEAVLRYESGDVSVSSSWGTNRIDGLSSWLFLFDPTGTRLSTGHSFVAIRNGVWFMSSTVTGTPTSAALGFIKGLFAGPSASVGGSSQAPWPLDVEGWFAAHADIPANSAAMDLYRGFFKANHQPHPLGPAGECAALGGDRLHVLIKGAAAAEAGTNLGSAGDLGVAVNTDIGGWA